MIFTPSSIRTPFLFIKFELVWCIAILFSYFSFNFFTRFQISSKFEYKVNLLKNWFILHDEFLRLAFLHLFDWLESSRKDLEYWNLAYEFESNWPCFNQLSILTPFFSHQIRVKLDFAWCLPVLIFLFFIKYSHKIPKLLLRPLFTIFYQGRLIPIFTLLSNFINVLVLRGFY